jgi:hypothetical protein
MTDQLSRTGPTRRTVLRGLFAGGLATLAGCNWDGHFDLFGYTTRPNYDENVHTVYVPIFRNKAFQTTPFRGMEMELTRAVQREIEWKTPFKIQSNENKADTELLGTIITVTKNHLNRTQQNEVREGELVLAVEVVWRDLRSGVVLSNPRKPLGILPALDLPPFDPDNPPCPPAAEKAIPVLVTMSGRFLPEVGESVATAQQRVCNTLARQIVGMMEKDWQLPPRDCGPLPLPTDRR